MRRFDYLMLIFAVMTALCLLAFHNVVDEQIRLDEMFVAHFKALEASGL